MPEYPESVVQATPCGSESATQVTACSQSPIERPNGSCLDGNESAAISPAQCGVKVYGCTNKTAINFDPKANTDDGSCIFPPRPTITYGDLKIPMGNFYAGKPFTHAPVIGGGAYKTIYVSYSTPLPDWLLFDPLTGIFSGLNPSPFSSFQVTVAIENYSGFDSSTFTVSPFYPSIVMGCTNPIAINYNPEANLDDGSCQIMGCTNPIAINYNPEANLDDGSCQISGCTNPLAVNYNPNANLDDGSCQILGCTNPRALNYNPNANTDDGSCQILGCRNPLAANYDPEANVDGYCIIRGCTAPKALNYNPNANTDDGSCEFCKKPTIKISNVLWESYELPLVVSGSVTNSGSNQIVVNLIGKQEKLVSSTNGTWTVSFENWQEYASGWYDIEATIQTSCGLAKNKVSAKKPARPPISLDICSPPVAGSSQSVVNCESGVRFSFAIEGGNELYDGAPVPFDGCIGTWRATSEPAPQAGVYACCGGVDDAAHIVWPSGSYTSPGDDGYCYGAHPFVFTAILSQGDRFTCSIGDGSGGQTSIFLDCCLLDFI